MAGIVRNRILVVEDDPGIMHFLETALRSEGYEVITAKTGLSALHLASSHCPECILLDLGLPDMDGSEIISRVRAWTQMPILVISARGMEEDKAASLDLGADDYITKPFSVIELMARIRTALRHTRFVSAGGDVGVLDKCRVGDLLIDYKQCCVCVGTRNAHLTPIEFRIVAYLGKHVGRVMTYKSIIQAVWGPMAGVENNTVLRVHMASIRRKIELNPNEPVYILTEVGVGYQLAQIQEPEGRVGEE